MNSRWAAAGAVLLIGIVLACVYLLASAIIDRVSNLNPNVGAALITAVLGFGGLWYGQWQTRAREIAESHRQSKIEVYNHFFEIVERFQNDELTGSLGHGREFPDELRKDFQKLNRGLIIWAGPGVIRAWLDFRTASAHQDNVLVAVDKVYREIRKDLGNTNFGLKSGDLLRTTLRDPTEWEAYARNASRPRR